MQAWRGGLNLEVIICRRFVFDRRRAVCLDWSLAIPAMNGHLLCALKGVPPSIKTGRLLYFHGRLVAQAVAAEDASHQRGHVGRPVHGASRFLLPLVLIERCQATYLLCSSRPADLFSA